MKLLVFAQEIGYSNWNLEPLPESHGGRVILVFGDPFSHSFHKKISATAQNDGNKPIDMLLRSSKLGRRRWLRILLKSSKAILRMGL